MKGIFRDIFRQKIIDAEATPVPAFTRRDIHVPAVPHKAIAVIGMRRTGKTTFLWQILSDRTAKGMPRAGILYFNFDDERLEGLTARDLSGLLEIYYRLHPEWRDAARALLLFDEIQVVQGWEGFVRRVLDTENVELFLSGSSARMLSREVATSMRGRAMEALVFPFNFREFLRHKNAEPSRSDRLTKGQISMLHRELDLYLARGGFPEAQGVSDRDRVELLRGYVDIVILRDVIERHNVRHPIVLRLLTRHLLANAAGNFSVNRFYNDIRSRGLKIAKDTLYEYLEYLEDTFLVHSLSLVTGSERRRMTNPRKVYPVDPGLIPIFDRSGRVQPSKALETAVCVELLRRGADIGYVKTGNGYEVDFLARYLDGRTELIQVSAFSRSETTTIREIRALDAAAREYPHARLSIVTLEPETFHGLPHTVSIHDAAEWLLINE